MKKKKRICRIYLHLYTIMNVNVIGLNDKNYPGIDYVDDRVKLRYSGVGKFVNNASASISRVLRNDGKFRGAMQSRLKYRQ